jgi:hypothetical protein
MDKLAMTGFSVTALPLGYKSRDAILPLFDAEESFRGATL